MYCVDLRVVYPSAVLLDVEQSMKELYKTAMKELGCKRGANYRGQASCYGFGDTTGYERVTEVFDDCALTTTTTISSPLHCIFFDGHDIYMTPAKFYDERSLSHALNQGSGRFGSHPQYASNVLSKDGSIGLLSHHGLHGHNNDSVMIRNVHVHGFEATGIEKSELINMKLWSVELEASAKRAFLKADWLKSTRDALRFERVDERFHGTDTFRAMVHASCQRNP